MQNDHNPEPKRPSVRLLLQPNSERDDERQPEFVGPGSADLGLADYISGCYLLTGDHGNYFSLRFYLRKEFETSGQPKQIKFTASKNKNFRPESDDPHYRNNVEILDVKYKLKALIQQIPGHLYVK
jgi:hypothetical protein